MYCTFDSYNIDQLIATREISRADKDWKKCDDIRNYLDTKLVFIFDTKQGQEIYYLTEGYFKNKHKNERTKNLNHRQYVEYRIKQDLNAYKVFDAWVFSMRESIKNNN